MKRIMAMLLAVMMVLRCCGDGDRHSDVKDDGKVDLTSATGGEQGTYYAFGTVLAQQVSDKTSTNVTAVVSKGSQANVEDLQANGAQLGFVQSDVMSYAYNGEKLFDGNKITDFSVVAALYMEQVQIVTLDSGIKTVADLKGKTVSIGAKGSGVYFNALDILGAYGLSESDIKAEYLTSATLPTALRTERSTLHSSLQALPPPPFRTSAPASRSTSSPLTREHIDNLIASSPYYKEYTIAKDVYNTPRT